MADILVHTNRGAAMGDLMRRYWVPVDDLNCWAGSINFRPSESPHANELTTMKAGKGIHVEYEPGGWRPAANKGNDYLIDRVAQREKRAYSGVRGISVQDSSLQESMGPIQNHEAERLQPTDKGIGVARRMLHEAALGLQKGEEPPRAGCVAAARAFRRRVVALCRRPQDVGANGFGR